MHFASAPEQIFFSEADPAGAQVGLLRYGHVELEEMVELAEGLGEDTAAKVLETGVLVGTLGVDSGVEIGELDNARANGAAIIALRRTKYRIMNELGLFKFEVLGSGIKKLR